MIGNRARRLWRLPAALLAMTLVATSCGDDDDGGDASDTTATAGTTAAPAEGADTTASSSDSSASGGETTIRWFVGLGTGAEPEQLDAQQAVVDGFNESHDDIQLEIEIVDNEVAFDTLATEIAGSNAPDIIGPIGIRGSNSFAGQFLDLEPLVTSTGYDLSVFDPAQVEFWREADGALTALPFGVFPGVMYFNKELFDEAGLEYPPQEYGTPYADGEPWDMAKVAELAALLTVDGNGNDATNPAFDPNNIVQWGFHHQFGDDARQIAAFFGPGDFVADDGSAQIPPNWLASWQWYHDLIHTTHAAPNQAQIDSDTLGQTNAFNTGNVAMSSSHLWYTCCVRDEDDNGKDFWDLAVVPEYEGTATSKLHADTFRILSSTENADAAFEVLTYLLDDAAPELLNTYGGMPARPELRDPFFASLDELFPQGVNWQVAIDGLDKPDIPSHEANMPNFDEAEARIDEFEDLLTRDPDVDMATATDQLRADLDTIFKS